MYPRKKVVADLWNYDELPPADLIKAIPLERAAINQDEFARAEWFWSRRPKVLSESLVFFFFYLTVVVCLFFYVPETLLLLLVLLVAGAGCAFVDRIRINTWRTEYESSIKRVVIDLSERK